MKVIERTTMPDGTKIQLEDWSDKNTKEFPDLYGLQIGAYPIRKGYCKWLGWFGKPAKRSAFQFHRINIRTIPMMMCGQILKH